VVAPKKGQLTDMMIQLPDLERQLLIQRDAHRLRDGTPGLRFSVLRLVELLSKPLASGLFDFTEWVAPRSAHSFLGRCTGLAPRGLAVR
jgi:hypothetical protein